MIWRDLNIIKIAQFGEPINSLWLIYSASKELRYKKPKLFVVKLIGIKYTWNKRLPVFEVNASLQPYTKKQNDVYNII